MSLTNIVENPKPGETIFSPELAARFDKLVTLYPRRRSALIPMLLYAQDEIGYLSGAAISRLASGSTLLCWMFVMC